MTPELSKQVAGDDVSTYTIYFLSHFRELIGHGHTRYPGSCDVPFSEKWFALPTNDYNPGLAFAGMGLCLSSYLNVPSNQYNYVLRSLESFELEDIDISSYYHRNGENDLEIRDNINLVAYGFGHRTIKIPKVDPAHATTEDIANLIASKKPYETEEKTLVVCLVRGTCPSIEWDSNADVVDSVTNGDYNQPYHEGFKKSADEAMDGLARYIDTHNIDSSKALIWIIGHSRGAAIVNLMAAFLNEGGLNYEGSTSDLAGLDLESIKDLKFTKDRVFAYTLSASMGTKRDDANSEHFDNIFNIMNPEDYIPRIPLAAWGYRHFGRNVFFPSVCTAFDDYREYIKAVYDQFLEWTHIEYQAFHGFGRTNMFVRHAADISPNMKIMYEDERFTHGGTLTFQEYFRDFCDIAGQKGIEVANDALKLSRYADGPFEYFLAYFLNNQIAAHEAPGAHQEEGYLAKTKFCYEMGIELKEHEPCDTYRFSIYGPVEVWVTDESGKTVARIKHLRRDKGLYRDLADTMDFLGMFGSHETENSSIWVPEHGNYTIHLKASKTASYDVTIAHQTQLGDVIDQQFFADVPLPAEEVTWDQVKPDAPTKTVKPLGDPTQYFNVDIDIDGPIDRGACDVLGVQNAHYGDHVAVHAYHDRHHRFVGWFDKASGDLLSENRVYRFRIEKDREFIARFRGML